eukprot:gene3461-biopygen18751
MRAEWADSSHLSHPLHHTEPPGRSDLSDRPDGNKNVPWHRSGPKVSLLLRLRRVDHLCSGSARGRGLAWRRPFMLRLSLAKSGGVAITQAPAR